jgi:hypothetical protein
MNEAEAAAVVAFRLEQWAAAALNPNATLNVEASSRPSSTSAAEDSGEVVAAA